MLYLTPEALLFAQRGTVRGPGVHNVGWESWLE